MRKLIQSHTLGLVLAGAGAISVQAIPHNVNDNATQHLVLLAPAFDNPSVVQGHSLVYRYIGTGGGSEQGANTDAFNTVLSSDGLSFTVTWDATTWDVKPAYVLVKTSNRWGTWAVGNWSDDVDSMVLENKTIRIGRGAASPLAVMESIALYGTLSAKDLSGPPSGTPPDPGSRVPESGSAMALLGLGALGAAFARRWGTRA